MNNRKIAFLFAGQGAQRVSMGKDFYETFPEARVIFDQLDEPIREAAFNGPQEVLNNTIYTQQALLAFGLAVAGCMDIKADATAGLSLGEYVALTYAKTFTFTDALTVVTARSQIMHDALAGVDSSMMAVLNVEIDKIEEVCEEVGCSIANINSPKQIVITGYTKDLNQAKQLLSEIPRAKVIPLDVAGGFHSQLLEEASKKLNQVLNTVAIQTPTIPVIFNLSGQAETENIADLLTKQIHNTVRFSESLQTLIDSGIDTFIEISPKPIIKGFLRQLNPDVFCECVSDVASFNHLREVLHD